MTWDLFTARFVDCIFNEDHFPALGGELYQKECQEIDWNAKGIQIALGFGMLIPKLFYPHELQKNGEIEILQTKSCDNLADLFTKSLPYIGMRRLRDLQESGGESH